MLAFFLVFIILCVVYAFLIMPRCTERPSLDELMTDYAHRGCFGAGCPENSLGAFKKAVEQGFGIELDVRLTKDKQIVVFHDPSLLRMCGEDKDIEGLTLAEIKEFRLQNTEYEIPALSEVLDLVDGQVPLFIEIKGEGKGSEISCVLTDLLDSYSGAFCVSSFNPYFIEYFKSYRPQFVRGQHFSSAVKEKSIAAFFKKLPQNLLFINSISRPDVIAFDTMSDKNFSLMLCLKAFRIKGFAWTVRDEDTLKRYKKVGICSIFEKFGLADRNGRK